MEYLIFIKKNSEDYNGNYNYQFDFTEDAETAWGEHWDICPAANIPGIKPDINSVSSSMRVIAPYYLNTMPENTCFSMQDCIDGLIMLGYGDINEKEILKFPFGMEKEEVVEILKNHDFIMEELSIEKTDSEALMDDLIDRIGGDNHE